MVCAVREAVAEVALPAVVKGTKGITVPVVFDTGVASGSGWACFGSALASVTKAIRKKQDVDMTLHRDTKPGLRKSLLWEQKKQLGCNPRKNRPKKR